MKRRKFLAEMTPVARHIKFLCTATAGLQEPLHPKKNNALFHHFYQNSITKVIFFTMISNNSKKVFSI